MDNFDTYGDKKYEQAYNLISRLYKNVADNIKKEPSVEHYVNGKNYIPLWVIVNTISMGDISKFYSSMLPKERSDVARRVKYGVMQEDLKSYLFFLSAIRNRCAHDERLFSYLSYVGIPNNTYLKYFRIRKVKSNYFALITIFKILLPRNRYSNYHDQLDILLKELNSQLKVIPPKVIRNMMGMPEKWRRLKGLL